MGGSIPLIQMETDNVLVYMAFEARWIFQAVRAPAFALPSWCSSDCIVKSPNLTILRKTVSDHVPNIYICIYSFALFDSRLRWQI